VSEDDRFIAEVRSEFGALREELKDINKSLQSIVRLEGEINRHGDSIDFMLKKLDKHDDQLQQLNTQMALNSKSTGRFDRWSERVLLIVTSLVIGVALKGGFS